MPRRARIYIPGLPYHIVQRGNNRQACFLDPADFRFYLDLWQRIARRYGTAVHAYCLMTNHVHFLVTPESRDSISRTMKDVGSRFARYVNRRYKRTGTLWEGRHRSSLVQSDRYLLTCYRYIELNPVRAGMVRHPGQYEWSSFHLNSRGKAGWLVPREEYLRLGRDARERGSAYRDLFSGHLSDEDLDLIRRAAHFNQPVADEGFRKRIESRFAVDTGHMTRGRPRSANDWLPDF
ncbi:MAG: transposase [Gammaproteobacteria bacterium]|nr:transposase [Gammaproteobacteria bacterium]